MNVKPAITLTKHHGLGNDFLVVVDLGEDHVSIGGDLACSLCDRRTGVGADGLILGQRRLDGTLRMVLYNADGSRAEMSGNGIRCLAQALAAVLDEPMLDVSIETDGGERRVTVIPSPDRDEVRVRVEMGPVGPGPALAPWPGDLAGFATVALRSETADVGNPHLVIQVEDAGSPLAIIGATSCHTGRDASSSASTCSRIISFAWNARTPCRISS